MGLLDHFHAPLSQSRHWESFHAVWAAAIVGHLNSQVLPAGYFAEAQVHVGSRVEVDIPTWEESPSSRASSANGPTAVSAVETWAPPAPALVIPAVFPDEIEAQVFATATGPTLVAALELISPGNKDRPETRRAFAAKCAAYLQAGIGLIIVDIVTDRLANLHDELMSLMDQRNVPRLAAATALYTVAYHPVRREDRDEIALWPQPLALGQPLPIMPLALRGGPTVPVDLDQTYRTARQVSRLE